MAPREETSPSQLAVSCCSSAIDWTYIDNEFPSLIAPVHATLAYEEIGVEEAGELFSELLASHLQRHNVIRVPSKPERRSNQGLHQPRAVVKLTERLAKAKNV